MEENTIINKELIPYKYLDLNKIDIHFVIDILRSVINQCNHQIRTNKQDALSIKISCQKLLSMLEVEVENLQLRKKDQ